jgi:hypothetical protein
MSEMTRRDHYICAYIAQGMNYAQAELAWEQVATLAAAGEQKPVPTPCDDCMAERDNLKAEIIRIKRLLEKPVPIESQPVSRAEYDKQVARANAAEGIVDDLKAQIARLHRLQEPLTEEEGTAAYNEWTRGLTIFDCGGRGMVLSDAAITTVKNRRA